MAEKRILFTFNHAPYGNIYYNEGLRAAVGATSGIDEHTIDLVYLGDGVYFTLKDVDRTDSARYINTLAKCGCRLKAEKESLESRGISIAEVAEDVEVVSRSDILDLIKKSDLTIDF